MIQTTMQSSWCKIEVGNGLCTCATNQVVTAAAAGEDQNQTAHTHLIQRGMCGLCL